MESFDPASVSLSGGHFINGAVVDCGDSEIGVLCPSDGRSLPPTRDGSPRTVEKAVAAARAAYANESWRRMAPRGRAAILYRWADLIDRDAERIASVEAIASARLYAAAMSRDVPAAANLLRYYGELLDKHEGSITATAEDTLSLILHEPFGVIVGISPWNFPMMNATMKFAPAIAAGNAVIMKPSELTPYSIIELAKLSVEAGLPPGIFNVVQGHGATAGRALVRHPGVDKISFTGSTQTGIAISADAAASGMKPVVMELGGKSPVVVFDDVPDLDQVANAVIGTFTSNAGQGCTAGTRLVVQEAIADRLVSRIVAGLKALKPGPTWDAETTLAPIVNGRQLARIEALMAKSISEGARVLVGGARIDAAAGQFYAPTVLDAVQVGSTAYLEEFFGPILSIQRFHSTSEAIALANHSVYGLAASVFTKDISTALQVSRRIEAGVVWINRHGRTADISPPAGGYKGSGFGKEWGKVGMDEFLRRKTLWIDHGFAPLA